MGRRRIHDGWTDDEQIQVMLIINTFNHFFIQKLKISLCCSIHNNIQEPDWEKYHCCIAINLSSSLVCHLRNFIHLKSHLALNQVRDTVIVLYWILMSVDWTQAPCCLLELIPVTDDWDCVVTLGFSLEPNWSGNSDIYVEAIVL